MADNEDLINNLPSIRCRYCGQRNQVRPENGEPRCGRCRMPLSDEPHKKFANLNKDQYIHPADRRALAALRAIPGIDTVVCKHTKSNAIVYARADQTVGVGAGQMSRVDSVKIAELKARAPLIGSAVASDAFFPFRDGVDVLAKAGATAVIQPGGSVRDEEVIGAANEHALAMLFTGMRHFRH